MIDNELFIELSALYQTRIGIYLKQHEDVIINTINPVTIQMLSNIFNETIIVDIDYVNRFYKNFSLDLFVSEVNCNGVIKLDISPTVVWDNFELGWQRQ